MAVKTKVALEIKTEIIKKVRDEGLSVIDISKQYGVSDKTIYGWLRAGISPGATVMENNRLKKEKQQLIQTIGLLTVALEKSKKGIQPGIWLAS